MEGFEEGTVLCHKVDDVLFRNTFAVHADTLSEIYEMWRGVETYFVALALEDGRKGM